MNTGLQLSEERKAIAEKCLDEGWSYTEITRTHGLDYYTLRKYFPGRGWTQQQAVEHGVLIRTMNRQLKKVAA